MSTTSPDAFGSTSPVCPPWNFYKMRDREREIHNDRERENVNCLRRRALAQLLEEAWNNPLLAIVRNFLNDILLVYEIIDSAFSEPIYGPLYSQGEFKSCEISVAQYSLIWSAAYSLRHIERATHRSMFSSGHGCAGYWSCPLVWCGGGWQFGLWMAPRSFSFGTDQATNQF